MLEDVTALLVMSTLADGQHCATLVRRGARIGNAQGELWQNGKLDATATATCMVAP